MSVPTTVNIKRYVADGVATVFSFPYVVYDAGDIEISTENLTTGAIVPVASGFTISGLAAPGGISVTFSVAPTSGLVLLIERVVDLTQPSVYVLNNLFASTLTERNFDRVTFALQQLQEQISRCPKYRSSDVSPVVDLGPAVSRANKIWGFDSAGNLTLLSAAGSDSTAATNAALSAAHALTSETNAHASELAAAASAASVNLPATPATGDMLYGSGSAFVSLAKGTANQLLRMNAGATAPEWATIKGVPQTPTSGDTIYYNGTNWVSLAKGTAAQELRMNAGATAPEWFTPAAATSEFETGDVKLTMRTTATLGWVMCDDGSIGNAASSATNRANADTVTLFTLLWNNVSDTYAPVSGGRGANAAADYAANKRITLTKMLGRTLGIAGAGSGLTSRALGFTVGEETHTLDTTEIPSHTHTVTPYSANNQTGVKISAGNNNAGAGTANASEATGGGLSHNNMQPSSFLNAMIRL